MIWLARVAPESMTTVIEAVTVRKTQPLKDGHGQDDHTLERRFAEPNFRLCFKINQLQNGKPTARDEINAWDLDNSFIIQVI